MIKIRPIINVLRNECVKTETEELHSVDEQMILSKTKFTKIKQENSKKKKKKISELKNLFRSGSGGFMYEFYLYSGKENTDDNAPYNHLQKSAQVVAKLCQDLPEQK